ncbi:hypothetical protein GCM10022251_24620 [Phytohabitans flavus]|uniref:FXSXX-COOH protein n=1 Tax=Phytohabitans flavus TaxID=1076124 RepID=A0A6F8XR96_9ACTN|nr:FxSxx-COOH cyclophane-containing RiPP peptide [Phytohabitans flavus]BCB76336.1 hypothetical protein Pflav_027460 [Phytohabitans flavus]
MYEAPEVQPDAQSSAIPDLRSVPLEAVLATDDSVLSNAVRRLLGDLSRPSERYAAHGNALDT